MAVSKWSEWSTRASAKTRARPEQVWKLWTDVQAWSQWDHEVEVSSLEGAFVVGAQGVLKPRGGPMTRFTLTRVEPPVAFSNRSSLPLATLDFVHTLRTEDGETVIEHQVTMRGPLTFLFSRLLGKNIARGLPTVVKNLARTAEG
ncbi:MAG: SRPBCC family protein [Bdellovibrionales bacterium]|nr:SRPBCC family protein [Bdellovibrionales bacterium]